MGHVQRVALRDILHQGRLVTSRMVLVLLGIPGLGEGILWLCNLPSVGSGCFCLASSDHTGHFSCGTNGLEGLAVCWDRIGQ